MTKTGRLQQSRALDMLSCPECGENNFDHKLQRLASSGGHMAKRSICNCCGWQGFDYPLNRLNNDYH